MGKGIISYGEAFIDYIAQDAANEHFEKYSGGTTLNVAAGVRRLGEPSYYICKLGQNQDSKFIRDRLKQERVNQEYCAVNDTKEICSVYVHLNKDGERYFHSYINKTPDDQLLPAELNVELFAKAGIFYFGSGTLFHPAARKTTLTAIQYAKQQQCMIAFDPNIRLKRWENDTICRGLVLEMLKQADILKLSDEELLFLMQASSVEEGLSLLQHYQIPFVWVTLGKAGAIAVHQHKTVKVPGMKVQAVDTTGAGDAFMAGLLYAISSTGLPKTAQKLESYTAYANILGARAVTKQGALTAILPADK